MHALFLLVYALLQDIVHIVFYEGLLETLLAGRIDTLADEYRAVSEIYGVDFEIMEIEGRPLSIYY